MSIFRNGKAAQPIDFDAWEREGLGIDAGYEKQKAQQWVLAQLKGQGIRMHAAHPLAVSNQAWSSSVLRSR